FSNALRELGIEPEQRVALLMNDTVDYPVAFWGTIRSGAIAIPLNTYLPIAQYAFILADCRARVLVIDAALAAAIAPVLDKLRRRPVVIIVGDSEVKPSWPDLFRLSTPLRGSAARDVDARPTAGYDGVYGFEGLISHADATPFTADTLSDEVAFWLYTSG